ncbi:methyl-accepting chemotaxis protein [Hyalangium sp.]|uniref:methyl-accepting chemotaxis protein n=1 Tax=Hyalangium sp. TaxID=2028555 RepID=UPI002D27E729|nr:methyl-accepting chemotaxis protein [Hyalangium sp.]HYI00599.1 methyl-accepting chemotaxis protein [Hyalangium sp.]
MGSLILLLSDTLSVGLGTAAGTRSLLTVMAARMACLLLPGVAMLALRNFPEWQAGPRTGVALASLWLLSSQIVFYVAGTQRTMPHTALLVWSVFFIPLVLPLRSQARGLFYAFTVGSYAVLELALDPGYPLAQRMLGIAALGGVTGGIAWSLERILRALRHHFFLKQEMTATLRALENSHARVGKAAETIGELVEKLRDSTLELSSESSRARSETARIANASETVALMAQAASHRASGAGSIVSQATGHTQRIDDEMNQVESGVNSIGQAIGLTEASLLELVTSARQIVEFTQTLQEFANQTDVLALNAAMEAARAGEAGRSFSVVAREVRRLAEASKDSSVKIHEVVQGTRAQLESALQGMAIIRDSTHQFETRFTDARKTLEAIRQIVTQIESLMRSTVVDAQEQARATGGISSGATQLQRLITSHAQMSEDVAITADRLGQQAEALRALLPKKEPQPEPPKPQVDPTPSGPLPGSHAVVA